MLWVSGGSNPDEVQFESLYNEEVIFLSNQEEGIHARCPWLGGNSGWNSDDVWSDYHWELRDRNANWKQRDSDK